MKRIIFSSLGIAGIVAVGWYYLPEQEREKAGAFVASALSRNREVVVDAIREKIIPETPLEKREKLITNLKVKIRKTRERLGVAPGKNDSEEDKTTEVMQILQESENIIQELSRGNTEEGPKEKIMERILDAVLPAKSIECKE